MSDWRDNSKERGRVKGKEGDRRGGAGKRNPIINLHCGHCIVQ